MVFGPPIGKQLICFVDDVGAHGANVVESYNPLEVLRLDNLLRFPKILN